MNPFLEVPVSIETTKIATKNNFWKTPYMVTDSRQETLRLRPSEIETYQSDGDNTHIIMKSGKEHIVAWPQKVFEDAMTSYNDILNSKENKGKFGTVVITAKPPDKVKLADPVPNLKPVK